MDGHRHGPGPEHDFEPVPGLPEPLPAGERIVWQGAPEVRALALRVFHVRKVAIYFALVGAVQVATALADGDTVRQATAGLAMLTALAVVAVGLLWTLAWLSSKTTLYTVTDRRVVMRVGIVLTMSFNIPYGRVASAGLRVFRDGTGDLPLTLAEASIGYAHLWPHARPWRLRSPEPMLRGVADAAKVGALLADGCGWEFHDADNFHPAKNVAKMQRGKALTDADRWPWLDRLNAFLLDHE
ncbi:MAG: photosynthetic complex putative assembly protein PuhB, partial [Burkholderiales bacterium]